MQLWTPYSRRNSKLWTQRTTSFKIGVIYWCRITFRFWWIFCRFYLNFHVTLFCGFWFELKKLDVLVMKVSTGWMKCMYGKTSVLYYFFDDDCGYDVGILGYQVDFFSQKCLRHTIDLGNCHASTTSLIGAQTIVCGRRTVDIYVPHRVWFNSKSHWYPLKTFWRVGIRDRSWVVSGGST